MEKTPSCKKFRLMADEYIEGELTAAEMLEKAESGSKGATVFYFAAAAVLMGFGIWKIVKAGEPVKSATQKRSRKRV